MSGEARLRAPLAEEFQTHYRTYAALTSRRLKDIQTDAIDSFLKARGAGVSKTSKLAYFAAPRVDKNITVVVDAGLARRINQAAESDGVSGRNLIYSALIRYHTQTVVPELHRHGFVGLSQAV